MDTRYPLAEDQLLQGARSRGWIAALALLTLANTFNHVDRSIIAILAEPIKLEFGLADWQIGALTGLSFAVLYGISSLVVGHLADQTNRARLIAICCGGWSLFTTMGAFAQSYVHLVVLRMLVGAAEGGGSAPSQSLILDLAPKPKRASALAVLNAAIPLGSFLGLLIGGVFLDLYGWRMGLLVAGVPGLLIAVLLARFTRDPRRQQDLNVYGRPRKSGPAPLTAAWFKPLFKSCRDILSIPPYALTVAGGVFITFVNYSQTAFLVSYFMRNFGDELELTGSMMLSSLGLVLGVGATLGAMLGVAKGLPGIFGTLMGGLLTDRLWSRSSGWLARLPAIAAWARIPIVIAMLTTQDMTLALALIVAQALVIGIGSPGGYISVQLLVRPDSRSLAAAMYMFALNVLGLGLGPLIVGAISDGFQMSGVSTADALRNALILSGLTALLLGGWLKWAAAPGIERRVERSA